MASGDEIVEERPSVAGTTPTASQDTNVDADSSVLPEKAEIVTMQTTTVMIEEPKQVVQRLRADMGEALCVCILGSRVFQGRDSEELVKAVAKEFGRSLGERAAFVTGGMPGVQKTFALNCGDGLRMWNLVSNTGSSGFGVGEDVRVGRDPAQHSEVLGLLGDLYFTIEGGPATAQEARAAHNRGATVIPVTRSGGASSGLFDFPSAAMKRPPCATEEHWAALQSPEAPLEAVAQAATAIALALAGALERPQPEAHEAAAASPSDIIPDNSQQTNLQADVAAPSQATLPEEAADGPADPTPAGLELSQPPMPLSPGLGDDDVEQLDVEPVPSRGRANVSAEPEEASLGSPKRQTGQSDGKSPTKATSSPKSGTGTGTGEVEAASRARDLISRELLDELSQADDWNEGRVAPTPPIPGFETPSETRTPSPGHTPRKPQYNEGLMCLDQWDWKTDAPEFVPGSMKGLLDGAAWAMPRGGGGQDAGPEHLRVQFEWQLKTKSTELRDMQNRMNQLEIETAQVRASWEMERRNLVRQIGHYRAVLERYCIPLDEAAGASYGTEDVSSYCTGFEPSAPSQWGPSFSNGAVSTGGGQQSQQSQAAYSSDSAAVASTAACGGGAAEVQQAPSTLDSKMRQLNHLLQEDSAQSRRKTTPEKHTNDVEKESTAAGEANGGYSSGSIASTLRAMFPHATVRTGRNDKTDGAGEKDDAAEARKVEQHLRRLERSTSGTVDDRALRSFHALSAREAREALQKVEDLVQAQGGHCRNLSSILQSVCRKIEKRSGRPGTARQCPEEDTPRAGWCGNGAAATATREAAQATRAAEAAAAAAVSSGATGGDTSRSRRVRQADEDGDAFDDSSESAREGRVTKESAHDSSGFAGGPIVRTVSMQSQGSNVLDTPAGKRSWADIQSGDEDDPPREEGPLDSTALKSGGDRGVEASEDHSEDPEYWISQRIEKAARRGFDLRRRGDHWDLKISMGGLDPPLTEAGMEKYCRWLMVRFSTFREEHGSEPLRRCRGEVDFSHNHMNNQMVWMLLETLAQYEVHTALLKLFANHISQGGVLAICEFIRKNDKAEALQELHLSHNEIDDESALELLRVLHSHRPRYPPRRTCEGTGEYMLAPVWLRLNHNRIREPDSVRRIAEAEGITVCGAKDRQACGTSRCNRRECPLVHLYSFNVQARRRPPETQWQPSAGQQPPSESEENPGVTGDQRGVRRKRNRKPGAKDFKKELDDSVEVDVARG